MRSYTLFDPILWLYRSIFLYIRARFVWKFWKPRIILRSTPFSNMKKILYYQFTGFFPYAISFQLNNKQHFEVDLHRTYKHQWTEKVHINPLHKPIVVHHSLEFKIDPEVVFVKNLNLDAYIESQSIKTVTTSWKDLVKFTHIKNTYMNKLNELQGINVDDYNYELENLPTKTSPLKFKSRETTHDGFYQVLKQINEQKEKLNAIHKHIEELYNLFSSK